MNSTFIAGRETPIRSGIWLLVGLVLALTVVVVVFQLQHRREAAQRLTAARAGTEKLIELETPAVEAALERATQRIARWGDAAHEAMQDENASAISGRQLAARKAAADRTLREAERMVGRLQRELGISLEHAVSAGAAADEFAGVTAAQSGWQAGLVELRDRFEFAEFGSATAADRQQWLARQELEAALAWRQEEFSMQRLLPTLTAVSAETRAANERANRLQTQLESLQSAQLATTEHLLTRAVRSAEVAPAPAATYAPPASTVNIITIPDTRSEPSPVGGYYNGTYHRGYVTPATGYGYAPSYGVGLSGYGRYGGGIRAYGYGGRNGLGRGYGYASYGRGAAYCR